MAERRSSGGAAAISATDLVKKFGENAAVAGVDLEIPEGEIFGFLGPNGAGKTTTVRMLVTLLKPTGGRAEVAGYDISRDAGAVRLAIGVALQEAALDGKQTGIEILRLQGRLYGLRGKEIDRRVSELRELIDIGDALGDRVESYSGGMKRRLDLAAALVHNPRVLFLDEPTTGLDPVSRNKVWEEVRRLNDDLGMTIFLTTQYLEEADQLADRVGIIAKGKIVAKGTPEELKRGVGQDLVIASLRQPPDGILDLLRRLPGVERVDARGNEVYVASPDGSKVVGDVAVALREANIEVERLIMRTPTLDDVFLEVTGNRMNPDEESQDDEAEVA